MRTPGFDKASKSAGKAKHDWEFAQANDTTAPQAHSAEGIPANDYQTSPQAHLRAGFGQIAGLGCVTRPNRCVVKGKVLCTEIKIF